MSSAPPSSSSTSTSTSTRTPSTSTTPTGVPFGMLPGFLPGASSLVEQLDRRLLVVLRDGRHLVGVLRSFDQFSNCILEDTSERRFLRSKDPADGGGGHQTTVYTDVKLGLYLIRGDSVVLLGEVEDEGEDGLLGGMREVTLEEYEKLGSALGEEGGDPGGVEWDFDRDLL